MTCQKNGDSWTETSEDGLISFGKTKWSWSATKIIEKQKFYITLCSCENMKKILNSLFD